jgi:hypothetical protein
MSPDMECLWRWRTELTGGAQRIRTYDLGAFGVVSPRPRLQSTIYHLPVLKHLYGEPLLKFQTVSQQNTSPYTNHAPKKISKIFKHLLTYKGVEEQPGGCRFDYRWGHWDFHWLNPSGRTMTLRSIQPLTQMRYVIGGKDSQRVGLTLPPSWTDCL